MNREPKGKLEINLDDTKINVIVKRVGELRTPPKERDEIQMELSDLLPHMYPLMEPQPVRINRGERVAELNGTVAKPGDRNMDEQSLLVDGSVTISLLSHSATQHDIMSISVVG